MSTTTQGRWLHSGMHNTCCLCGGPITDESDTREVWSQFITNEMDAPITIRKAHRECAQMLADDEEDAE